MFSALKARVITLGPQGSPRTISLFRSTWLQLRLQRPFPVLGSLGTGSGNLGQRHLWDHCLAYRGRPLAPQVHIHPMEFHPISRPPKVSPHYNINSTFYISSAQKSQIRVI